MRTSAIALDASCVGKLFLTEKESGEFREWYRRLRSAGVQFRAPHLLQFELGNVLRRVFGERPEKGKILQTALQGIELVEVDPAEPFAHGDLTYYDAAYVCVGTLAGALATYDEEMAAAAQRPGSLVHVWTGKRIKASIQPGFVVWLKTQTARREGWKGLAIEATADSLAQDAWSYLEFQGYLEEFRQPSDAAVHALEEAFAAFAATAH